MRRARGQDKRDLGGIVGDDDVGGQSVHTQTRICAAGQKKDAAPSTTTRLSRRHSGIVVGVVITTERLLTPFILESNVMCTNTNRCRNASTAMQAETHLDKNTPATAVRELTVTHTRLCCVIGLLTKLRYRSHLSYATQLCRNRTLSGLQ